MRNTIRKEYYDKLPFLFYKNLAYEKQGSGFFGIKPAIQFLIISNKYTQINMLTSFGFFRKINDDFPSVGVSLSVSSAYAVGYNLNLCASGKKPSMKFNVGTQQVNINNAKYNVSTWIEVCLTQNGIIILKILYEDPQGNEIMNNQLQMTFYEFLVVKDILLNMPALSASTILNITTVGKTTGKIMKQMLSNQTNQLKHELNIISNQLNSISQFDQNSNQQFDQPNDSPVILNNLGENLIPTEIPDISPDNSNDLPDISITSDINNETKDNTSSGILDGIANKFTNETDENKAKESSSSKQDEIQDDTEKDKTIFDDIINNMTPLEDYKEHHNNNSNDKKLDHPEIDSKVGIDGYEEFNEELKQTLGNEKKDCILKKTSFLSNLLKNGYLNKQEYEGFPVYWLNNSNLITRNDYEKILNLINELGLMKYKKETKTNMLIFVALNTDILNPIVQIAQSKNIQVSKLGLYRFLKIVLKKDRFQIDNTLDAENKEIDGIDVLLKELVIEYRKSIIQNNEFNENYAKLFIEHFRDEFEEVGL